MRFYTVNPDVPGFLEESHDEILSKPELPTVHYPFECWPDDDIVQSFPALLVSERLGAALTSTGLTGFELGECISRKGEQFHIPSPGRGELPRYFWLKVNGEAQADDFGISGDLMPVVSERAMQVLRHFHIPAADIAPVGDA